MNNNNNNNKKINIKLNDYDEAKIKLLKQYYGYEQTSELLRFLLTKYWLEEKKKKG